MFAGPNGSGKSTIKGMVEEQVGQAVHFGHYINPDEIAARAGVDGFFDFAPYGLIPNPDDVLVFVIFAKLRSGISRAYLGSMEETKLVTGNNKE